MSARMEHAMMVLDEHLNAPVKRRAPTLEHLRYKAAVVGLDQGTFHAVISSERRDREKDIIPAVAMVRALRAWIGTGKRIPLAWCHGHRAEDLIGHIDPETVQAKDGEEFAQGWVDQSTDRGREAWRAVKSGTLGFSFGYVTNEVERLADGGRRIHDLEVFEISCTSTPMQHATRVIGWKAEPTRRAPSLDDLDELERELELAEQQVDPVAQDRRAACFVLEYGMADE